MNLLYLRAPQYYLSPVNLLKAMTEFLPYLIFSLSLRMWLLLPRNGQMNALRILLDDLPRSLLQSLPQGGPKIIITIIHIQSTIDRHG